MKLIFTIIILVLAIPLGVFSVRAALNRSKVNRATLAATRYAEKQTQELIKKAPIAGDNDACSGVEEQE